MWDVIVGITGIEVFYLNLILSQQFKYLLDFGYFTDILFYYD